MGGGSIWYRPSKLSLVWENILQYLARSLYLHLFNYTYLIKCKSQNWLKICNTFFRKNTRSSVHDFTQVMDAESFTQMPFFTHPMISGILSIKVTFAWISINSFCWMESHQMSADAENMKKLGAWKSAAIEGMAASRGAVVSGFQRQLLHPPRHHHTTRQTHWPSPHLVSCALPEPGFHWEEGIPYHTCKWFEDIFSVTRRYKSDVR